MKHAVMLIVTTLVLAACGREEPKPAAAPAPVASTPAPTVAASPASDGASAAAGGAGGAVAAGGVSTPSSAVRSTRPDSTRGRTARPEGAAGATHTVARGETLSGIGARYGVSAAELARWNNIADPRRLQVGRTLRVKAP